MNERERAERILANLSSIGEDLLAFSDDLWQGTNYRDPKERERRLQVIDAYNSQLDAFAGVTRAIESMIRQAAGIPGENCHHPVPSGPLVEKHQEHTIDEDFTFTRPLGFALRGQTYKDTLTWKQSTRLCVASLPISTMHAGPRCQTTLPSPAPRTAKPSHATKAIYEAHFSLSTASTQRPITLPTAFATTSPNYSSRSASTSTSSRFTCARSGTPALDVA